MSKLTIGLLAGAALASAAAVTAVAISSTGGSGHDSALNTGSTPSALSTPSAGAVELGGSKAAVQSSAAATTKAVESRSGSAAQSAKEVRIVHSVKLILPTTPGTVGSNVSGSIQAADATGTDVEPGAGAAVALQQKRGTAWVTVSDGMTDASGQFPVSFTSRVNSTWRAQLTPLTGAKVFSAPVNTTSSASVTWASRPDLELGHGVAANYSFRVTPAMGGTAHLEMANSKTPTKWVPLKAVVVPETGVVVQSESFPTAGSWILRGTTAAGSNNVAGYTTSLIVHVS